MKISKQTIKQFFLNKKTIVVFSILVLGVVLYFLFFKTLVVSPIIERNRMVELEVTKQQSELSTFESDGCSGNVSSGWSSAIQELSKVSSSFADRYTDTQHIPFESACVVHDEAYHKGEGGYVARLQADNALRSAIISYGINNAKGVRERTGINSDEEVIFLYEVAAEAVYRGVRIGGAPCTGTSYAWGFGYGGGTCD